MRLSRCGVGRRAENKFRALLSGFSGIGREMLCILQVYCGIEQMRWCVDAFCSWDSHCVRWDIQIWNGKRQEPCGDGLELRCQFGLMTYMCVLMCVHIQTCIWIMCIHLYMCLYVHTRFLALYTERGQKQRHPSGNKHL